MGVYRIFQDELAHSGVLHLSGRYREGTGDQPYQCKTDGSIRAVVTHLRGTGMSDTEIAKHLGISTTTMRQRISLEKEEARARQAADAVKLKEKGYSNVAIGARMNISEGKVRDLLKYSTQLHENDIRTTANTIREELLKKGVLDVGRGNEVYLGISSVKLKTAISLLEDEGFPSYDVYIQQLGTSNKTTVKVLTTPDITKGDILKDPSKIQLLSGYSDNGGLTLRRIEPPVKIDPKRVQIAYAEDGGILKDGLIEIRPGVADLSLGMARYAQVRIATDGDLFMKGMAVYSDDLPPGVDIRYNTNKKRGTDFSKVLKPFEDDPDNPFGATIKSAKDLVLCQRHYIGTDGKEHQSALNIVNEEGDWGKWSKTLSSQFLSKQNLSLVRQQLDISLKEKQEEFESLKKLTNPVIKKDLLDSFGDDCDAAAVHLKAAGLPRQASHVILPFPNIKENEIYAPNYRDGERVVLVRHPHAGRFELPELVVNNRYSEAKKILGNAPDAVGIHWKVAEKLSGADFDGDTVLVLPNDNGAIRTRKPLKQLEGFDPKAAYPSYPGMKVISEQQKQLEMGKVSNLITDMTIRGGSKVTDAELARAVKHSMVVIDAKKHKLNWKLSEEENGIAQLREKYQPTGGASTLVSRSKGVVYRPEEREGKLVVDPVTGKKRRMYVDPDTGQKLSEPTGRIATRWDPKTGTWVSNGPALESRSKMSIASDARSLSSGTPVEEAYASYANSLKALGNEARKISVNTENMKVSPSAKKTYAPEIESLKAKLDVALSNAPLERRAQALANYTLKQYKATHPEATKDSIKKVRGRALRDAREITGASKTRVNFSDKEWEAIQAGAISTNFLQQLVANADKDRVRALATPRASHEMSSASIKRAKDMLSRGYTQAEVANALGLSLSTLRANL